MKVHFRSRAQLLGRLYKLLFCERVQRLAVELETAVKANAPIGRIVNELESLQVEAKIFGELPFVDRHALGSTIECLRNLDLALLQRHDEGLS